MTGSLTPWPRGSWRKHLAASISNVDELLAEVGLSRDVVGLGSGAGNAARLFELRVPRAFVRRMGYGDPADPLLLQVLPSVEEDRQAPGFVPDPVGESEFVSGGGVLHKYRGRALIVITGICAVHCRYCFRRHFAYGENSVQGAGAALEKVAQDPSISEVILSGGDPLSLSDESLDELFRGFENISHVRRLRVHTRMPVVLPERVDSGLLDILGRRRLPVVVVLQTNHAQELDRDVRTACQALREAGVTLLNQAVLLAGINDTVENQVDLSEGLFDAGVLPYYLHLMDRVAGAAHFEVAEDGARSLMAEVSARLPGYLVPRLVRDEVGAASKVILSPS
ncbi:MAG: EF-P beta-lysylation protein EpmB [Thermoanaerobaculales bacterium]|nr:EF-P beta-lysylation protein EpmB [Thermoanaerobaculales bacterium]